VFRSNVIDGVKSNALDLAARTSEAQYSQQLLMPKSYTSNTENTKLDQQQQSRPAGQPHIFGDETAEWRTMGMTKKKSHI
jgi:hypothetical protein